MVGRTVARESHVRSEHGLVLPLDEEQAPGCIHNATTTGNATEEGKRLLLLARASLSRMLCGGSCNGKPASPLQRERKRERERERTAQRGTQPRKSSKSQQEAERAGRDETSGTNGERGRGKKNAKEKGRGKRRNGAVRKGSAPGTV